VEKVLVAQSGVAVARGQALLLVYSPEIYQAEGELLAAKQWAVGDAGSRSLDASRKKLELLGMASGDVDRVLDLGEPMRAVPVYAPLGGFVTKKNVVLGSSVTPEMTLYEIQDLSTVYVIAAVFQRDIGLVHPGTQARFTPTPQGGDGTPGKVDLIYPVLDPQARTTRVRMQLRNPGLLFRPGEYGNVEFDAPPRRLLMVPRDAVVDTGEYSYVFVVEGEGRFSPRVVALQQDGGDEVAVLAGLTDGERVVSGATFLIDSESRLAASLAPIGGR
jgi:Cu(I)/Ag(I) efflux system membrane fusion protein